MKVVTVIGARPQFVKAAVASRLFQQRGIHEILVHTGQHYDPNMSEIFFDELGIPKPAYNLGVGSGSHGLQTGKMLAAIEEVLQKEKPDWVILYGDTNSTLAGALTAVKLHIKIAHIEAGLRSYNNLMPEEINRILTDRISSLLFCPSNAAVKNLEKEGITAGVYNVGDVMIGALQFALGKGTGRPKVFQQMEIDEGSYILTTLHRAETTDYPDRLLGILEMLNSVNKEVIFPVHPRTHRSIETLGFKPEANVHLIDPVGYLDMVQLEKSACLIMTDSGGIQKEAYWLKVPCITLRTETEWVETVETGWNRLAGYDIKLARSYVENVQIPQKHSPVYGSLESIQQIASIIESY